MKAMVLHEIGKPLISEERSVPTPARGEALIKVLACGVCRTDLHVVDGELPDPGLPLIPGHEIIGEVVDTGDDVELLIGDHVAVPWLGWTCGQCEFCRSARENLCNQAKFTGYQIDGGYCEYTTADARFCIPIAATDNSAAIAPLVCAGLIGFRSLQKVPHIGDKPRNIGIYGFGAAAHILAQIIRREGDAFYAFTRPGDKQAQQFALTLGAAWVGDAGSTPPMSLDAAIIFAPVGRLVPDALRHVKKGGTVVCGGIHMSEIPAFAYDLLWGERELCSVANLTREDGRDFFERLPDWQIRTQITPYPLEDANKALDDLRTGKLTGAAVLVPGI